MSCPHCNYLRNPGHAKTCAQCKLELPRTNPPHSLSPSATTKLAIFDLDQTLFDISRRERIAKREGNTKGSKGWYKAMNKPQHIPKDAPIEGTLQFVKHLVEDGHIVAYLSGRPARLRGPTREKLRDAGFPIHEVHGEELIFLSPADYSSLGSNSSISKLVKYKSSVLTRLSSQFDARFYFDDTPEFRNAAKKIRPHIAGIYSSIADYTGDDSPAKNNPPAAPDGFHYMPDGVLMSDDAHANPSTKQSYLVLPPVPHLSKLATKRLTKLTIVVAEKLDINPEKFVPDVPGDIHSQKLQAALTKTFEAMKNPTVTGRNATRKVAMKHLNHHKILTHDYKKRPPFSYPLNLLKKMKSYLHGSREYIGFLEGSKLSVGTGFGVGSVGFAQDTWDHCVASDIELMFHTHPTQKNDFIAKGFDWYNPSVPDHFFGIATYLFANVKTQAVIQKEGIHFLRSYIKPNSRFAKLIKKKKLTKKDQKELNDLLQADFKAMPKIYKTFWDDLLSTLGVETSQMFDLEMAGDATAMLINKKLKSVQIRHDYFPYPIAGVQWKSKTPEGKLTGEYRGIRANGPTASKGRIDPYKGMDVNKAKTMYKQFHQKGSTNTLKKTVDIGETWVGLGKAWSIGYRSPKETGVDEQKYIHNFGKDEQTGEEHEQPELYYVKNNDGSQMMVIMGGDWYIDLDSDGETSWIYI